jgi:hypothetical protein
MARLAASTSQQIADGAGLNERYVREGLGTMVNRPYRKLFRSLQNGCLDTALPERSLQGLYRSQRGIFDFYLCFGVSLERCGYATISY